MRRLALVLAVVAAGTISLASVAWAGESISSGSWTGSALDPAPAAVGTPSYRLSGTFRRSFDRQVEVAVSASPAGSGACAIAPVVLPWANTPRAFDVTLSIPCNGSYRIVATAVTTDNNALLGRDSAAMDRQITVAAPAPQVTGVSATADGRSVSVAWDDMRAQAPDLTSYIVERKIGDGSFDELATLTPDDLGYTDEDLPAAGGEATYRVLSTRPSPDGTMTSQSSDGAATPFEAAPAGATDGGSGGTSGAGDGTGAGGGGGAGASTSGGTGSSSGHSSARVTPPRVFSGTFLPPLLRPVTQTLSPPTTTDDGYSETLAYGDEEAGGEDPVLPQDELSSVTTERQAGRGMAIPVATALVLAVWAVHLRLLARAARPVS